MFKSLRILMVLGLIALAGSGCFDSGSDDGDSSSAIDFGDNDPGRVVALGDSITEGVCVPDGPPYPARLADLSGKQVINQGLCGERSGEAASRIGSVLKRYQPGYIVIFYGANDAIFALSPESVANNLRNMCNAAIANKTVPLLATCLPMYDRYSFANATVLSYNPLIRELGKELGVKVIDLEKEFGNERSFLQSDGLHPSDAGNQVIALAVNDRIPKK
ncbi:MAG TPA: GDSL-type esterase/lipase family protein [Kiritimatiellia bacterium]|nr:GDSL-type esterase/lipase family protein [Kiritimatiellia bacterium]